MKKNKNVYRNIIVFLLMVLFLGCNKSNSNKDMKEIVFRKGIIFAIHGEVPFTGLGISFYDKNHIESKGFSINGIPVGEWEYYFYNGKLKKKGEYREGKMDGEWIYYKYDGNVEGKILYKNGKEIRKN